MSWSGFFGQKFFLSAWFSSVVLGYAIWKIPNSKISLEKRKNWPKNAKIGVFWEIFVLFAWNCCILIKFYMVLLLSWKKAKKMLKRMFLINKNTFKIIILCFPKVIHFKALKVLFFDNFLAFFMMKTSCKCLKTNFFASK